MARYLEYKLHAMTGGSMTAPPFITNGGHWPYENELISVEPDAPAYYVPKTVNVLTLTQLKERQVAIHAVTPFKVMGEDGMQTEVDMTNAQVEAMVDVWADSQ